MPSVRLEAKQRSGMCVASFLAVSFVTIQTTSAIAVIPNEIPRSMKNLVLGTVALPKIPSGDPIGFLGDAYERGFRRFDLARTYGMGQSEKIFGTWLDQSGVDRTEICIVTKGGMGNDKYGDPNRAMCTESSLRGEIFSSLGALQTNYADLYMLHRDDPRIDVRHFVDWMNGLKQDGLIERWGVSNWSLRRIMLAYDYAIANGLQPPSATSPQLSLAVPSSAEIWPSTHSVSCPSKLGEIAWYKKHGIEVMGWEALAKGFMAVPTLWREHEIRLSTFHGPDAETGSDEWRIQRIQRSYCTPANYKRRRIAHKLAREAGLSLAQVSLLFSLSKGDHVSVLVGADRTAHLDEMAELRHWSLDEEAVECLTAASTKPQVVARVAAELWGSPPVRMDANGGEEAMLAQGSFNATEQLVLN